MVLTWFSSFGGVDKYCFDCWLFMFVCLPQEWGLLGCGSCVLVCSGWCAGVDTRHMDKVCCVHRRSHRVSTYKVARYAYCRVYWEAPCSFTMKSVTHWVAFTTNAAVPWAITACKITTWIYSHWCDAIIRKNGSILYLGMTKEISNSPQWCTSRMMAKAATKSQTKHADRILPSSLDKRIFLTTQESRNKLMKFDFVMFLSFKLNRSAKWEEAVETCDHVNTK